MLISSAPVRDTDLELDALDRAVRIELSNQRALFISTVLRQFSSLDDAVDVPVFDDDGKIDDEKTEKRGLAWGWLRKDLGLDNFQILICIVLFGHTCSTDFTDNFRIEGFPNLIVSDMPFPFAAGLYYVDYGDDTDDLYFQSWDNFSHADSLVHLSAFVVDFCGFSRTRYLLVSRDLSSFVPDYD